MADGQRASKQRLEVITGRSLGTQIYLVNIEHDRISQREHVDDTHWCAKETYQSL